MSKIQSSSTNSNPSQNEQNKIPDIYLPPNKTGKKTLVLDLDETLVHSQFGPFDIPSDVVINIEIENEIHDIHVLVRPGVKEFLEKISKKYEIVIFTASISKYAGPLLDILDKNKLCSYRLFREHCTLINSSFVKDLKKLGRDLKDVVILDNSPMAYLLNNDNGLPILTWFDDKDDRELYKVIPILDFLSLVSDVRDYICKMVVNNEISYSSAMKVINDYNEMLRKKQNEKNEKEKEVNIIDNNNELSDSSENNLVFINKNNNEKGQQININIINNNITNYIYDNKNQDKKENINNNNYSNNNTNSKNEKTKFNPKNIIASVSKPNINQKIPTLSSLISNQKQINKSKNNSMKNLNNKEKKGKNNSNKNNLKIEQYNTNNYIHKKSESMGIGYKNKTKKNKVEIINSNMTNYINNNNQNTKTNPIRNNTNYSSKSYNRKEIKISNPNNVLLKDNKMTKSTKSLKNTEKPLLNKSNKNILVKKKIYDKNNSKNKIENNSIRLYNDGNMTTVHKKQKSLINFNSLKDKTCRNNYKNKSNIGPNNLLHSVDFTKNEVATYYHNDNFPFFKKNNFNSINNNINNGGITTKNNNRNKFLKSGKNNNSKKNVFSSSIDNKINTYNNYNNLNNNINNSINQKNCINTNKSNNFNYIKKKNNDKQFSFNRTLQKDKEKKKDNIHKNINDINDNNDNNDYNDDNNDNNNDISDNNNNLLSENNKNNSAININSHSNFNPKFDLTRSYQINQRSESMKDLNANNAITKNKNRYVGKNKKKGITNSYNKRPKSSNVFKRTKDINSKNHEIKRNVSGKRDKNLKGFDINEILERRGIAKTNRTKDSKENIKYNLNGNFVFNNSNINSPTYRNKSKNDINNKAKENIIKIKTKDS